MFLKFFNFHFNFFYIVLNRFNILILKINYVVGYITCKSRGRSKSQAYPIVYTDVGGRLVGIDQQPKYHRSFHHHRPSNSGQTEQSYHR